MMNKLFLASMLAFLVGVPASFALNLNPQNDVVCGMTSCSLTVDLGKYLTANQLNSVRGFNLTNFFLKKDLDLKYYWNGTKITIYSNIAPGSKNYWVLNTSLVTIDPWFNSSLPYCMNISYTSTDSANRTDRIVRFNITDMSGANSTNGTIISLSISVNVSTSQSAIRRTR